MIKIENTEVIGWEAAIRGMRNPQNSWDKSDSYDGYKPEYMSKHAPFNYHIGPNDHELMMKLRNAFKGDEARQLYEKLTNGK